jgi:hypothetical protein
MDISQLPATSLSVIQWPAALLSKVSPTASSSTESNGNGNFTDALQSLLQSGASSGTDYNLAMLQELLKPGNGNPNIGTDTLQALLQTVTQNDNLSILQNLQGTTSDNNDAISTLLDSFAGIDTGSSGTMTDMLNILQNANSSGSSSSAMNLLLSQMQLNNLYSLSGKYTASADNLTSLFSAIA